jgi:predicted PP-loop superfamily ATPase
VQNILGDMKKYAEEKVDAMRLQKDEELEQYKKEIERAKRFENQKLAGAGSGGTDGIGSSKIVVKKKVIQGAQIKRR